MYIGQIIDLHLQQKVVHPKTYTFFSGFCVVLKDISYSNFSLSMSFSQNSSHLRGGWLSSAECRRTSL